jgi:hypothetical protein
MFLEVVLNCFLFNFANTCFHFPKKYFHHILYTFRLLSFLSTFNRLWQFGRNRIYPDGREQIEILMICLEGLYHYYMCIHISMQVVINFMMAIHLPPFKRCVAYFRHYRVKPGHWLEVIGDWSCCWIWWKC